MIRPGRPSDAAEIRGLAEAFDEELAGAGRPERVLDDAWSSWLTRRINAGDVRVAVDGDRLFGFIVWEARRRDGDRYLSVTDLYVRRSERRNRYGGGLLARALDRARSDSLGAVEIAEGLGDEAALALLESYGFTVRDGRLIHPLGAA